MFLINDLIAFLAANLILSQALGTSTIFIAAGNRKKLIGTACVITVFTTFGSAAAFLIDSILPEKYSYFTLFFYTLSVGILYVLLLSALFFISREKFAGAKKYIHLSAFNCAVMGSLLTISTRAAEDPSRYGFGRYILSGIEAGFGFVIAAVILSAAFHRLTSSRVPASFRGFPAMLIYLGIISMAVYSLK